MPQFIEEPELTSEIQLDSLTSARCQLLTGILVALSVIGLPATIIACIEANKFGQTGGMILYSMIYLLIVATTLFSRRLHFNLCSGLMLGSLYLISIFNLLNFSFSGAGIELGITISVLATVMFGTRSGLLVALIFLVSLFAIGLLFFNGVLDVNPNMPATTTQMVSWLTAAAAFALFSGTLVLSSGMLQGYLIRALSHLRQNAEKLEKANTDLTLEVKHRKETEKKLIQSEKQFKTLFELAPDAMFLSDLEGRFLDANQTAEAFIGRPKAELIGKNFFEAGILPENEISTALSILEENMHGNKTGPDEITFLNAEGNSLIVEILTSPFQFGDRSVIIGIARDISERKRIEKHLHQTQKMESVGRLAGGVAHDFNNMLSIILGNSEIMMEDIDPNHPCSSNLEEIQNAAQRSADLTLQLLAFARKQTISPKILNPNHVIEGMLKMLKRLIGEDIDLLWHPQTDLWPIKIDPSQIDQMLANLCVNARDAIKDVGKLTIETGNISFDEIYCEEHTGFIPGNYIVIGVSDNGCGMDRETTTHLFEPFFTTKKKGEGTGLGLATVYGIVKQNNGFINVYSELDQGSTFKIYLPKYFGNSEQKTKKEVQKEHLKGHETILLVEDEGAILKMTRQVLEKLGYEVLTANTPDEALQISNVSGTKIDLLITDVVMPSMNGRELAERILLSFPNMKCLYMSGYTANVVAHRGILDEGLNFINKPFSKQELSLKLREILRGQDPI